LLYISKSSKWIQKFCFVFAICHTSTRVPFPYKNEVLQISIELMLTKMILCNFMMWKNFWTKIQATNAKRTQ